MAMYKQQFTFHSDNISVIRSQNGQLSIVGVQGVGRIFSYHSIERRLSIKYTKYASSIEKALGYLGMSTQVAPETKPDEAFGLFGDAVDFLRLYEWFTSTYVGEMPGYGPAVVERCNINRLPESIAKTAEIITYRMSVYTEYAWIATRNSTIIAEVKDGHLLINTELVKPFSDVGIFHAPGRRSLHDVIDTHLQTEGYPSLRMHNACDMPMGITLRSAVYRYIFDRMLPEDGGNFISPVPGNYGFNIIKTDITQFV